jgi:hypothetical protein
MSGAKDKMIILQKMLQAKTQLKLEKKVQVMISFKI